MSFCMLPHIFRLKFFTLILIISVCTLWFGCSNYSNHIHQFNGFAYGQIADYSVVLFNVTLYIREDNTVRVIEVFNLIFENLNIRRFSRTIYIEGFEDVVFEDVSSPDVKVVNWSVSTFLNYKRLDVSFDKSPFQRTATIIIVYTVYDVLTVEDGMNKLVWPVIKMVHDAVFIDVYTNVIIPRVYIDPTVISCDPNPIKIEFNVNFTRIIFYVRFIVKSDYYVMVKFPKITEKVRDYFIFRDQPCESAILIFLFTTMIMLILYYFKGRIPSVESSVFTYYAKPPSNLTPMEASYLVYRELNECQILSTLIDLAIRKCLILEYNGVNVYFYRSFEATMFPRAYLRDYEVKLLDIVDVARNPIDLFMEKWSEVKRIGGMVENELMRKGYFHSSPSTLRKTFLIIGLTLFIVSLVILLINPIFGRSFWEFARYFYGLFLGLMFSSIPVISIGCILFKSYTIDGARELSLWRNYIDFICGRNPIITGSREDFERQLVYVVALAPELFEFWANNWIGRLRYIPDWIKIKVENFSVDESDEGFRRFINILRIIVVEFKDFRYRMLIRKLGF
ncbi:MAG: DUF2207 domain-containing protein [Candidatus Methanomethylicia archaeon]